MDTTSILQLIKKQGQIRDAEIASALRLTLGVVHNTLDDLTARREITCCDVTRYNNGKPVREVLVRASGYYPPGAPGRKPKAG